MPVNTFGNKFCITTWGESHGEAIGVVIDGMPSNVEIDIEEVNEALSKRAPGQSEFTSPRKEQDIAHIQSGLFNGRTTGAPISLIIKNGDVDSTKYESLKDKYRPGHADYTYAKKYQHVDYRGGGRASARETACRVAASVFAKKILEKHGVKISAYLQGVGNISVNYPFLNLDNIDEDPIFCPDPNISKDIQKSLRMYRDQGNSIGGVVGFACQNVPSGLGEPIYNKLESSFASAMMSIPASKGFEIGLGFSASKLTGAEHNDNMSIIDNKINYDSNNSGGILGGISTGETIYGRVAFKPTSSILHTQNTISNKMENTTIKLPKGSRHDPCVAIRGVKVVEAMCYLVLANFIV